MNLNSNSNFIIITDTHWWHKNIRNRTCYITECVHVINEIIRVIEKVKSEYKDEKVYIIFLGDVFHRDINGTAEFNGWVQTITSLRSRVNGIFSVVGNHEITYQKNNPFWALINKIESTKVKAMGMTPIGTLPIIRIVDHIDIFDTRIHLNHYDTQLDNFSVGRNILMSHEYWTNESTMNSLKLTSDNSKLPKYSKGNTITETSPLRLFDHCFFGHNHMMYGIFDIAWDSDIYGNTRLYYLGSLGLTQIGEVEGTSTDRMIPVLRITDSSTQVNLETINLLHEFKGIINKKELEKNQIEYINKREINNLKRRYTINDKSPIDIVRQDIQKDGDIEELDMFETLLTEKEIPEWITRLLHF